MPFEIVEIEAPWITGGAVAGPVAQAATSDRV
jgi:hypothetical protein